MSQNTLPAAFANDHVEIQLPKFRDLEAVRVSLSATKVAESRLLESRTVNVLTYNDLEYCFNEAYRELKANMATVGYQIVRTENELQKSRASAILDKYPEFIKDKGAKADNAATRDAFLSRDPDIIEAKDRLDSLKALEVFIEGRIKVMENVCRFMRKQMDLTIRSGSSNIPITNR